jgi:hypothetical protein
MDTSDIAIGIDAISSFLMIIKEKKIIDNKNLFLKAFGK